MSSAILPSPVTKEIRALAFPWLACAACMALPAMTDVPRGLEGLGVPAYFLGAAALGALTIGREYSDRTLRVLLSMPMSRTRLLAAKLGVLALLLLTLVLVAYTLVFGDSRVPRSTRLVMSLVPLLCGLGLAPFLTMACRNAIAGAVFSMAIPGVMFVAGELLGTWMYGHGPVMEAFRLAFVWSSTLGMSAIGFVASWWMFLRLEAIDGNGEHISLPRWSPWTSAPAAPSWAPVARHAMWLLVKKEVRLQQLAIAIAALHALTWIVASWLTPLASDSQSWGLLNAATIPYTGMISLVIGSSASAGERQIGTLEWQVLMPVAAWKQFALKVAVVLALTLALTVGLTTVLAFGSRVIRDNHLGAGTAPTGMLLMLAFGSLYVSSLSRGTLWALVMSLPATVAVVASLQFLRSRVGSATELLARPLAVQLTAPRSHGSADPSWIYNALTWLVVAGFVALVLRFALENHRTADRSLRRVGRQLVVLVAFATAAVMCVSVTAAFVVAMNRLR